MEGDCVQREAGVGDRSRRNGTGSRCPAGFGGEVLAGSAGSGDPFFPQAGNGGYDVRHYALTIDYDQPANVLSGKAVIGAIATQNLRSFNLDLRDLYTVSKVSVNGEAATFAQHDGQELTIDAEARARQTVRGEGGLLRPA